MTRRGRLLASRLAALGGLLAGLLAGPPCPADDFPDCGDVAQSVSVVDYNRDGKLDLAIAYAFSETVVLARQTPSGGFVADQTIPVGLNPQAFGDLPRAIASADMNRDGFRDLVVLCSGFPNSGFRSSVQVLLGSSSGTFRPRPAQLAEPSSGFSRYPTSLAVGDLNRDGMQDLAIGYQAMGAVAVLKQTVFGRFELSPPIFLGSGEESHGVKAVALADLDGDGFLDLAATSEHHLFLLAGRGDGGFNPPLVRNLSEQNDREPAALAVGDFDRDGNLDVAVAESDDDSPSGPPSQAAVEIVWQAKPRTGSPGRPNSLLTAPGLQTITDLVAVDWTRDGQTDVLAVDNRGNQAVVLGGVAGQQPIFLSTALHPRRGAVADINGDGIPDLVTANEGDRDDGGDPANPDVSVELNFSSADDTLDYGLEATHDLRALFADNLGFVLAATVLKHDRYWAADGSRKQLVEFDGSGSRRTTIAFSQYGLADISGFAFMSDNGSRFAVAQLGSPEIRRFENGNPVQAVLPSPQPPGALRGLAYRTSDQTYWYIVDGPTPRLQGVAINGNIIRDVGFPSSRGLPYNQLALAGTGNTIYCAVAGQSFVDVYQDTGGGVLALNSSLPLTAGSQDTVAGIGIDVGVQPNNLLVFTTGGRMLRLGLGGSPLPDTSPVVLRHAEGAIGLTMDQDRGVIYALCSAQASEVVALDEDGSLRSTFPLDQGPLANGGFVPAAIAFDESSDSIVVVDAYRPQFAWFDRNGEYKFSTGWTNGTTSPALNMLRAPITGFEIDPASGQFLVRSQSGLLRATPQGANASLIALEAADPGDIALGDSSTYLHVAPVNQRLDKVTLGADGQAFLGQLAPATRGLGGLATNLSTGDTYVSAPEEGKILVIRQQVRSAAEPVWAMYE